MVLTGAGRGFSAGVDLKRIVAGGPAYVAEFLPALSSAFLAVFEHPRLVVAAVNGHALAGGRVLAAACDVRLMSCGTIGLTELAAGVPFPTVPLEVMRHATGAAVDRLVLTAARLDPQEAHRTGLVDEVVTGDLLGAAGAGRPGCAGAVGGSGDAGPPAGLPGETRRAVVCVLADRLEEVRTISVRGGRVLSPSPVR